MPTTMSQVLILVAFLIPGFILVRVKRLSYPSAEEPFQRTLLDSLALSCIVHGLASPLWLFRVPDYYRVISFPAVFSGKDSRMSRHCS